MRGFASSHIGDQIKVWVYRKAQVGVESNIVNVGVERDFYGSPTESDLDARITGLEGPYADLIADLRASAGSTTPIVDRRIPSLVAHLSLRTRQIREFVVDAFDEMLLDLRKHLDSEEVVKKRLVIELKRESKVRENFTALLVDRGVAAENLDAAMKTLLPVLSKLVDELLPTFMPQFSRDLDDYIKVARSVVPDAVRAGFIDSLSRNLTAEQRTDSYGKFNWFLIRPASPIILGDTVCLFETTGVRKFKPLDEAQDEVRRIYLPVAKDRVLVGTPFKATPLIDAPVLNRAFSRCSYEYFVSSQALAPNSTLINGLGKSSGLLDTHELEKVADDVRRSFLEE